MTQQPFGTIWLIYLNASDKFLVSVFLCLFVDLFPRITDSVLSLQWNVETYTR